jgi:hypothetical protein
LAAGEAARTQVAVQNALDLADRNDAALALMMLSTGGSKAAQSNIAADQAPQEVALLDQNTADSDSDSDDTDQSLP